MPLFRPWDPAKGPRLALAARLLAVEFQPPKPRSVRRWTGHHDNGSRMGGEGSLIRSCLSRSTKSLPTRVGCQLTVFWVANILHENAVSKPVSERTGARWIYWHLLEFSHDTWNNC